jgi:NADH:ubiquinone oxidoreductase subunit 2 (subunit N)
MAGIPPLSGFFIKFFVLSELVYSKYYLLAAIGTFSSIISSFYYIALIKTLFFEDSGTENLEEFLYQKAAYQPPLVAFTCSLAFFFIAYPLFPGFINSLFTELALGLTLPFM